MIGKKKYLKYKKKYLKLVGGMNSNILDLYPRIVESDTLVIGAGYGKNEYDRLNSSHPNYIGIGQPMGEPIIRNEPILETIDNDDSNIDRIVEFLLGSRGTEQFPNVVIDRCVFNYFEKCIPHPTHGYNSQGEPNGAIIYVLNTESFGFKLLRRLIQNDGNLIIYIDDFERIRQYEEEFNALLPGIKIELREASC